MMSISISVNGEPVYTRSARNTGEKKEGYSWYKTDTGNIIRHKPEDGICVLAKKLIDTIHEV